MFFFTDLYGSDWMTPKKGFKWQEEPKDNLPFIINDNLESTINIKYFNNNYSNIKMTYKTN